MASWRSCSASISDDRSGSTIDVVLRLAAIVPATDRPTTLSACVTAIRAAEDPPEELIVVEEPAGVGAAAARNAGVRVSTCEILVFVDADVAVHGDAFGRIRARFDADPTLSAVFGSYDDAPAAPGFVSVFRNLLHHHVHQSSPGPATTFWTGLGAVRRDDFNSVRGLDEDLDWLEDVDLGMRLSARGSAIALDPQIQGTHLKRWSLWSMVKTDFIGRGIPWVVLLLRHRKTSNALNLGWAHRASAASSLVAAGALAKRRFGLAALATTAFVALNRSFHGSLLRRFGFGRAAAGVGLHALHHLVGIASVPAGVIAFLTRGRGRTPSRRR
jgi:GT2 family glycosyltransferase